MAKHHPTRIPKQFRIPRPMSSASEPVRLGWLKPEVAALALATSVAAAAPLRGLDEAARDFTARALADDTPSAQVLLVTAAPEDLRLGVCERSLRPLLERGGARGALLLPPADVLCGEPGGADARATLASQPAGVEAEASLAPPVVRLPSELLRQRGGEVIGIVSPEGAERAGELTALGVAAAPWVLPKAPQSIPAVSLRDLADDRVPVSALEGRLALVAVGSGGVAPPDQADSALAPARGAAAALGGLLDGGARAASPGWAAPLLVLLAGALIWAAHHRRGTAAALGALLLGGAALIGCQALLAGHVVAGLLPVPSALLALCVVFGGIVGVHAMSRRLAVDRAADLIERAALFRMQGVHTLPDEEFWPRVARLAEQAHPADIVLVAELPPRSWHLRFWNDQRGGESLVAERRRDVRRMPYSSQQGVPTISVTRRFLTRQDVPTVVVPLIAFGEIEGYVFLCGAVAEATFAREPERTERVARELALLVRRKRLARSADAPWQRRSARELVEGARVALDDLQSFAALLRGAPVGLLYADAFGDVRFLAQELARWLRARDVPLPPEGSNATLPPGSLTLGDVINAASTDDHPLSLSSVMASEEGIELRVGGPEPAVLHVRPLRRESDGASWIAGYVAALVPIEQAPPTSANVRALGAREAADPLTAFALGDVVAEAVASAGRATSRPLRLEPIRGVAHAIGHRIELSQALEGFLTDVAGRGLPGHGPVVSVREVPHGVQLSVLDVGFGLGLPESALQRVLMAPGAAPSGLEPLGRLILAVEDSHGQAELKTNDGWGITLTATLLRAHPRVTVAPHDGGKTATPNVISIGRAGPK